MRKQRVSSKKKPHDFAEGVDIALRQAARTARKIARMYAIYVVENGKVVAKKP
jgi:hypothetical protein